MSRATADASEVLALLEGRTDRAAARMAGITDGRLNPRFVEWMMGLPDGWACDVIDSRSRALHILGNGVVPQQAAAAIRELTA